MSRPLALLVALAIPSLVPASAHAYKVATTANEAQYELRWARWAVPYSYHYRGAEDVHDVLLHGALNRAFASWGEVDDAGLQFEHVPQWTEKASEPEERNVLYWIESEWPHGRQVIALTSINYYPDSGEIVDVDIAFNGMDYDWTVFDDVVETDVQSIATHEIGHMFGLDHSEDSDSVMWFQYEPGETRQRELDEDDVEAIAYMYPCDGAAQNADAYRLKAPAGDCNEAFYDPGCAVGGGHRRVALWVVGVLALSLAAVRRSRLSRLPLLLFGLALASGAPSPAGRAHVTAPMAADEVLRSSPAVVLGEVTAVDPYWSEDGHVHSRVEIWVEEWLRGEGPEHLELDRPAGELPEMGTMVPGEPHFAVGQRVLLALAEGAGGRWVPAALSQGYFEIVETDDGAVALRHVAGPLLGPRRDAAETYRLGDLLGRIPRAPVVP